MKTIHNLLFITLLIIIPINISAQAVGMPHDLDQMPTDLQVLSTIFSEEFNGIITHYYKMDGAILSGITLTEPITVNKMMTGFKNVIRSYNDITLLYGWSKKENEDGYTCSIKIDDFGIYSFAYFENSGGFIIGKKIE